MAHLTVLLLLAVWLWQVTSRNSGNSMLLNPMTAPGNLTGPTPMVIQVPNVLSAINNPAWNGSSTNESISLQPAQQFLWGSHNNSKQSTVLSMVMYSQEDELIVSMERFAHDLKSVECDENMSLTFKSNLTFGLVQKSWNWVNFNDLRTFVMVANYPGCGKNQSRDPWVVSNVTFDSSSLTVHMDAVLKTWKDVAHTYTLDFGDFTPSTQAEEKRFLDISFDKSFTVDLTSKLPTDIFSITSDNGLRNVSLDINCNDCGTTGDIVFRGHIEASLFDGITVLQLSATPHNISANLNLTFELEGMLNLDIADPLQVNKKLLTIPLPGGGFSIPDLITFGPNAQVSAGIALDSLEGQASIGFGIHASIPDTAVAVIDLHSKQKVDIHGWTPVITVEPLKIEAEIDAEVELYTEIAIAVSLLFFNDDGFQVDLGLRVPDVFVTAETVYDSAGVCSGSNDELGVILDATVGVNLAVEAYAEVDGALDEILNIPLFTDPDIFAFPEICIPFTVEDTNVCPFVPDSDDEEEYEDVEELAGTKRDISVMESTFRRDLGKRQIPWYLRKREPYLQACDPKPGMYPIQLEAYPSPTAIVAATTAVPVMKPGIPGGCTKDLDCSVGKWTLQRIPGTPTAIKEPTWTWAAEHIYEGNWVRDFIDYMDVTHFGQATNPTPTVCPADAVTDFFKTTPTSTLVIPVGNPPSNQISPPQNYTQALMQNLATWNTYQDLMAILPAEQNSKKYVTFSGNKNIYAQFMQTSTCSDSKQSCPANDNHNRFCWLGRMVSLCQYLNDTEIQSRLAATITGIHTVLDAMQADVAVIKPTSSSFTTFRAAHQTWFEGYWNAGIERLQHQTQINAQWMLSNPQPGDDSVTLQAIVNNPKDARFCYVQPFVYPTT